jgi:hypothetical protein
VVAHQSVIRRFPKVEVQCEQCGAKFKARQRTPSEKPLRFCSTACATKSQWESGCLKPTERKAGGTGYWLFYGDHPLTVQSKGKSTGEHRVILYGKIGPGPHPCHWCGRMVDWRLTPIRKGTPTTNDLVVDHVDANRYNNAPENLVPACNHCNVSRSRQKNKTIHVCEQCGENFRRAPSNNPKWVRFCSRSCRSKFLAHAGVIGSPRMIKEGELFVWDGGQRARAEKRNCAHCATEFLSAIKSSAKFCCHKCYGDSLKGRTLPYRPGRTVPDGTLFIFRGSKKRSAEQRVCQNCGITFIADKCAPTRYCSRKCSAQNRAERKRDEHQRSTHFVDSAESPDCLPST